MQHTIIANHVMSHVATLRSKGGQKNLKDLVHRAVHDTHMTVRAHGRWTLWLSKKKGADLHLDVKASPLGTVFAVHWAGAQGAALARPRGQRQRFWGGS